jgi:hypothetical protein
MRRLLPSSLLLALLSIVPGAVVDAQIARVPMDIEMVGCVLPAPGCQMGPDTITLWVQDDTVSFGIVTLSVFSGHRSMGSIIADMALRPLRTHGPEAVAASFPPGARLRIRAMAMLAERMLLVRSVRREAGTRPGDGSPHGAPDGRTP